jgi:hypothetical protein
MVFGTFFAFYIAVTALSRYVNRRRAGAPMPDDAILYVPEQDSAGEHPAVQAD